MLVERRRSAFPVEFLLRVAAAWAVVSALLLAVNWGAITTQRFPDPDDTMRLIQVRDLVAGQPWFDVTQYRVDAPGGGVPMHWSRLVDVPLALVILALTPLIGSAAAESVALVVVPLLTLGIAMLLAARIAWRLMGDEETTFTALIMAVSVPIVFQLAPMRIDHHGWQLVCALVAVNGLMARSQIVGGRVIGAACAVWLSISIEGLPLAAAIFVVLALRWLRDRTQRDLLVNAIQSLAIGSVIVFLATKGVGNLATYCDAISPLHIAMFAFGAVTLTALSRFEPLPVGLRLAGFAVAGAGALGILFAAAPQCATSGGFSDLDPLVRAFWYINVKEGMPVWHQGVKEALQYTITPVIGLLAAINLASKSRDWLRAFWTDYALILGASILVAMLVARAGAAALLIAAPPLAWQINRWLRAIRVMESPMPRVAAMLAVACALMPTLPLSVSALVVPANAGSVTGSTAPLQLKMSDCRIEDNASVLNALPSGEIFASLDIAPKLLLTSHHSVPATGHHRGNETMKLVIETSLGSSEEARETLIARGSQYVALCPDLAEPGIYAEAAPAGFTADLMEGRAPDWLEPVPTAQDTSFKLWRIVG